MSGKYSFHGLSSMHEKNYMWPVNFRNPLLLQPCELGQKVSCWLLWLANAWLTSLILLGWWMTQGPALNAAHRSIVTEAHGCMPCISMQPMRGPVGDGEDCDADRCTIFHVTFSSRLLFTATWEFVYGILVFLSLVLVVYCSFWTNIIILVSNRKHRDSPMLKSHIVSWVVNRDLSSSRLIPWALVWTISISTQWIQDSRNDYYFLNYNYFLPTDPKKYQIIFIFRLTDRP